ncbi:MAG: NlpC/P60 family protein [Bacteroidia bacterium]
MYGIVDISLVQVRAEPSGKSELTTQLLFGETYEVIKKQGEWLYIKSFFDNYEGWINENQHTEHSYSEHGDIISDVFPFQKIRKNNIDIYVLPGSHLNLLEKFQTKANDLSITDFAKQFLGTPYLWGGKSFLGIDCSGLVQVVYKCYGINLPRDAYQQARFGLTIDFLSEAKANDLAFFENQDGNITHVGILLSNEEIIHASGFVRIDSIDSFGIFNKTLQKHTHKLKFIKRLM